LSPGEQQRVAFARALLFRPDWLFLDEASTALDEATEAELYRMLKQHLPDTTLISIAHDTRVVAFHDARILIDPRRGRASFAEVRAAE
jgi:putative ATP-binding cassette transporter